ncbi:hypothetical protein ACHQM5_005945 [Ranunculus cassubicifolius]
MSIVVNVIKLSSLFVAKKSLGSGRTTSGDHESSEFIEIEVVSHENEQLRLQEPENSPNSPSYWFGPDEEKTYVVKNVMNIDGKASDYIQRFHEKNRILSKNVSLSSGSIVPPPPGIK